ncbi:MAG: aminotransferase class I/II-fold pyridoxal phosphate-dependent enzyme, partial [bacterium]|nr:aminotransferase class I/II-fold pyridoxal phosphate-dependent enzyme [bacterium]
FDSGRTSIATFLQALGLQSGDEVLCQAFTCIAVPQAVRKANGTPIFVDIGSDLNMDVSDLEKKITSKSRAIIVQHTFGAPADLDAILAIAKKHRLFLIEDCAHSLGGVWNGKKLGTIGDAAILSFGRDKAISGVDGGALLVNNPKIAESVKSAWSNTHFPARGEVVRSLLHPLITMAGRRLYGRFFLGQALIGGVRMIGLLEKKNFGARLPHALAELALLQWGRLEAMNARRRTISKRYREELDVPGVEHPQRENDVFLRYPLLVDDPQSLRQFAKSQGILLGDWYNRPFGSCPQAERVCKSIVNLPTMPWMIEADVDRVIHIVKEWISENH